MPVRPNVYSRQIIRIFILVGLSLSFTQSASAEEKKWYIDLGYQATNVKGDDSIGIATYDARLGSVAGHVGYSLTPFLSVEVEFGLGLTGDMDIAAYDPSINFFAPPPIVDIDQNYVVGLSGRLQHTFGDNVVAFAKGGVANSKLKLTRTSFTDVAGQGPFINETDIVETGAVYGAGVQFYVNESNGIRFDLTRYEIDAFENTSLSLGYAHRF